MAEAPKDQQRLTQDGHPLGYDGPDDVRIPRELPLPPGWARELSAYEQARKEAEQEEESYGYGY